MRNSTRKKLHIAAWVLFCVYAAAMLYLLLIQRLITKLAAQVYTEDYLSELISFFEPVPYRTTIEFLGSIKEISLNDFAFRNLAGNIVLFIPIGVFLPLLFLRQRKFPVFLLTTVITVCVIELTQAFTLLGFCDIDDLILNTSGACIGFLLYRLILAGNKKDESSDPS